MISIRRQLTREMLAAFFILLSGALAAIYFAARDELIEQFDDALRAKALAISSLTSNEGGRIKVDVTDRLFRSFRQDQPEDYFEIWSDSGPAVSRSDSLAGADLPKPDRFGRPRRVRLPNGHTGRAMVLKFFPAQENGEHHGDDARPELILVVASDGESLSEALTELLSIGAVCSVLLAGTMLWLIPRVLRRGLQPLAQLGEQAAGIDADSLTTRFPTMGLAAELQPIVSRLNELLARLEISFERERRFSADLAHELRTPLAELRSLAECSIKWPESRESGTDQEVLAVAMQMQTIVTNLLILARAEQRQAVGPLAPVDVRLIVEETWQSYRTRAEERGLKMRWELSPVNIPVDAGLLRSILGNLFENAADYAPAGGEVRICLERSEGGLILKVANQAEGLELADVPKLFDRFWRKEEARTGGRHFGLGLPLARMFAKAMGWTLTAALDEKRQLEFTLTDGANSAGQK
jgi:two-component system sensor histidine kinase QseC